MKWLAIAVVLWLFGPLLVAVFCRGTKINDEKE